MEDLQVQLKSGEIDPKLPARLQISMFNSYCSGEYLYALCHWLKNQGLTSVEFQVADTLQKHNISWRNKCSTDQALSDAYKTGNDWFSVNAASFKYCYENFSFFCISRWEDWMKHTGFSEAKESLQKLLETDNGFRDAINQEIELYFEKTGRSLSKERRKISQNFLIEEMAVSEISARYWPANEIYPGPRFIPEIYLEESKIGKNFFLTNASFIHVDYVSKQRKEVEV